MAKSKIDFRHITLEAIMIVFTVLLALALSEWRMQVKRDQLVDRVITSLKNETERNVKSLNNAITYHKELLEKLRSGQHVIVNHSLSELPFDPKDDTELSNFIKSQVLSNGSYVSPIEVINDNRNRFLRMGNDLSTIEIKNDSLFIYGSGNIILRSAQIRNNSWQIAQATNALIELDFDLIAQLGRINTQFEDYQNTVEMAVGILYGNNGAIHPALEDMFSMEKELLIQYEAILDQLN